MKSGELVASIAAAAGFTYLLKMSLHMQNYKAFWTGPGAIPFVLCAFLAGFSLWWAGDIIWNLKKKRFVAAGDSTDTVAATRNAEWKRLGIIVALTFVYTYALTPLVGFTAATVVFLLVSILIFGEMHWGKSILLTGVVSCAVYTTFHYVLHLPMPR